MVSTHLALLSVLWLGSVGPSIVALEVDPSRIELRGSDSLAQAAVTGRLVGGRSFRADSDRYPTQVRL